MDKIMDQRLIDIEVQRWIVSFYAQEIKRLAEAEAKARATLRRLEEELEASQLELGLEESE